MRTLVFSTLYPNAAQPNFGVFVDGSVQALQRMSAVRQHVMAPLGVPPPPLDRLARYRALTALPAHEMWGAVPVERPRFPLVPGIGWPFNPWLVARSARPVLRRLRRAGCDFKVIDAQFFYPCGVAAAALGAELGLPVLMKARGSDIKLWSERPPALRMMLRAAGQATLLVAVSQSLKTQMVALGFPADKIEIHYTGVDLARFALADKAVARQALGVTGPLAVSVGALVERKGHALLLEALAHVPDLTLWLIGGGPNRANLEAQAARLGVAARVRFLGVVPHAQVASLLGAADLSVMGSYSEGLANAWVESLACGTPVVTTDVEGAREAIDRPAAGRVVPGRDARAFADAMRAVLAGPSRPAETRAAAERFGWDRHVATKVALLEAVAGRRV